MANTKTSYNKLILKTMAATLLITFSASVLLAGFLLVSFPALGYAFGKSVNNIEAMFFHAERAYLKAYVTYESIEDSQARDDYEFSVLIEYHVKAMDAAIQCMLEAGDNNNKTKLKFYSGKVDNLVADYLRNNHTQDKTRYINNLNTARAKRSFHPYINNYDGYIKAMRTRALYNLGYVRWENNDIRYGAENYAENYAHINFNLFYAYLYEEGGAMLKPLGRLVNDLNLRIDNSMAEYLDILLDQLNPKAESPFGLYEPKLFENIVDPAYPNRIDFDDKLKKLSSDMLSLTEDAKVADTELLTALSISVVLKELTLQMWYIFVSHNNWVRVQDPTADINNDKGHWESQTNKWSDHVKALMKRYVALG